MDNEHDILNIKEAALYLRVSVPTLRSMARVGKVPCFRINRMYRFRRSELMKLMEGAGT